MTDAFWLNRADFQPVAKVSSAHEMAEALKRAPKQVIAHHITRSKNDFANWAKNGLHDADLAARLSAVRHDDPDAFGKVIGAFSAAKPGVAALPKPAPPAMQIPHKH